VGPTLFQKQRGSYVIQLNTIVLFSFQITKVVFGRNWTFLGYQLVLFVFI